MVKPSHSGMTAAPESSSSSPVAAAEADGDDLHVISALADVMMKRLDLGGCARGRGTLAAGQGKGKSRIEKKPNTSGKRKKRKKARSRLRAEEVWATMRRQGAEAVAPWLKKIPCDHWNDFIGWRREFLFKDQARTAASLSRSHLSAFGTFCRPSDEERLREITDKLRELDEVEEALKLLSQKLS